MRKRKLNPNVLFGIRAVIGLQLVVAGWLLFGTQRPLSGQRFWTFVFTIVTIGYFTWINYRLYVLERAVVAGNLRTQLLADLRGDKALKALAALRSMNMLTGADSAVANADLRYANFQGASLQQVNFTGADLRYANLHSANLQQANLSSVDVWDTDFTDANLRGATLTDARHIVNAKFNTGTTLPDGSAWQPGSDVRSYT